MAKCGFGRAACVAAALTIMAGAAAPAHAPPLAVLDGIDPGAWELRARETGGPVFNLCLGDPRQLLQVRHSGQRCSYYVLDSGPGEVTVSYSCPGAGSGRTTLRVETSRLVQIHTQGVADGAPFAYRIEGRRKGECR